MAKEPELHAAFDARTGPNKPATDKVVLVFRFPSPQLDSLSSFLSLFLSLLPPTESQRNESFPSSLNANPLTASPLEHFSEDENIEDEVSLLTDRSEKSEPPEDPVEPHS